MGATFCASPGASDRRLRFPERSEIEGFRRRMPPRARMEAELAQAEKKGMPTGVFAVHPLTNKKIRSGSPITS